jgi:hypothetical protein
MQEHLVCIRCGRKLKTPESRELGFGKVCYAKWQDETLTKPLFGKEGYNAPQQRRNDAKTPDSTK